MRSMPFKAIELDRSSHQRTGREHALEGATRQAAIDQLLGLLQVDAAEARIDPTRTLIQLPAQLWTLVRTSSAPPPADPSALRRAGAKHRRVR